MSCPDLFGRNPSRINALPFHPILPDHYPIKLRRARGSSVLSATAGGAVDGRKGGGFAPFNGGRRLRVQSQVNNGSMARVAAGAVARPFRRRAAACGAAWAVAARVSRGVSVGHCVYKGLQRDNSGGEKGRDREGREP